MADAFGVAVPDVLADAIDEYANRDPAPVAPRLVCVLSISFERGRDGIEYCT